jgi:hypothetical protein
MTGVASLPRARLAAMHAGSNVGNNTQRAVDNSDISLDGDKLYALCVTIWSDSQ